jgi:dCTP deaminase
LALPDTTIKQLITRRHICIEPFDESRVTPAGYDLASANDILLEPGEQRLVATLERVGLPTNVLGILHLRSSFAREGLIASLALVDPGFRGQLTVSLANVGKKPVTITQGERFLQLTFIELTSDAMKPYNGRYQNSFGIVKSKRETRSPVAK